MTVRELEPLVSHRIVTFWLPIYPNGSQYPVHIRADWTGKSYIVKTTPDDARYQDQAVHSVECRYNEKQEEVEFYIFLK